MYLQYIPKLWFQSLMMVLDKSFIVLYRVINMKSPIKKNNTNWFHIIQDLHMTAHKTTTTRHV